MVQSTTTQEIPDRTAHSSDFLSLLAGIGFSLFWTVIINLLLGFSQRFENLSTNFSTFECIITMFCFFIGFVFVQFLSYSRIVERPANLWLLLRIAGLAVLLIFPIIACALLSAADVNLPTTLVYLSWVCSGLSAGLLLPAWGTLWTQLDAVRPDSHATSLYVSFALVGSAALCGVLFFLPISAQTIVIALLYLGSVSFLLFCTRQLPSTEFIDIKTSRKHLKLFSRMMFSPFLMSLSFGIVLGLSLRFFEPGTAFLLVVSGVALASIAMVIVLLLARHVPRHSTFERWMIPLVAVFLVLSIVAEGLREPAVLSVLFVLLVAVLCFSFISHWNILTALSYRHQVHPVYHYAQGLIAPIFGATVGVGACGAAVIFKVSPADLLFIAFLGLLPLLVLVQAISPPALNKTIEAVFEEDSNDSNDELSGSWRVRCQNISVEYALSPREIEVFKLLAKGRNAEYISKTLVVSVHTAKTHISRIYRKLNINSQQELINLVDSR